MDFFPRLAALFFLTTAAWGHELDLEVRTAPPVVIVKATYAGTEVVPFAKVQIFAPSSPGSEYQTGVTDKQGHFSFVPAEPGAWRIVVDDETGHRREATATVPAGIVPTSELPPSPDPAPAPRWERVVLGLSLLFGATGFLYGWKARKPTS